MSFSFASCSDDDDDPEHNQGYLIGTWESTWSKGFEYYETYDHKVEKDEWDDAESGYFLVFNEDGTGYDYEEGYEEVKGDWTWKVSGNQLIISYEEWGEESYQATIKELSKKTLKLLEQEKENGKVVFQSENTYSKISK